MANEVNRERVAVLSTGLLMDAEMVAAKPDPSYVMSVCELEPCSCASNPEQQQQQQQHAGIHSVGLTRLGVCAVDVASGHILLGEFLDDEVRSLLRTHLAALQPVEVLLSRGHNPCGLAGSLGSSLDPTTSRVLRTVLRDPRANFGRTQWDADRLLQALRNRKYFSQASSQSPPAVDGDCPYAGWPPVLAELASTYASAQGGVGRSAPPGAAALMSLSGLVDFLEEALLDRAVLPMGRMEALPTISQADIAASAEGGEGGALQQQHMLLNGAALENLEVLENAEGGVGGTLLSVLDHCSTPFGRRRLRQWLCRPLYQVRDIELRQDAVSDLMTVAAESAGAARKDMSGISDLERAVARLAASTVEGAAGRDADHVVLYEDAARRKVKALTGAIRDLQAVSRAVRKFYPVLPWAESSGGSGQPCISSKLLLRLFEQSRWSQIEAALDSLAQAANWSEAEKTGRVTPAEGVDARNDAACKAVAQCQAALSAYLTQVRKQLGGGDKINFVVAANRDRLLEVPDTCKITKEFTLDAGGKKGFKRYTTERLAQLSSELRDAEDEREAALSVVLQSMVRRFVEDRELWVGAVESVAELDALMSLAAHALNAEGSVCRPKLLPPEQAQAIRGPPVFEAKGLRHPSGLPGLLGSFVPNDVSLGGPDHPAFIVLTGPNMGGKSTLLRQVCLAALLAQIGGCVPADSLTLSPVDAIFVRMGAKDHIMTGQSTFFVELAETAAMLHKATSRSLVALDELGRGTATLDGAAIASAVLHHMSGQIGCRGLFATHYHHLSSEHAHDPNVAIMHMACAVSGPQGQQHAPMEGEEEEPAVAQEGLVPEVTFLYKLVPGACPKSYGTNVARLAGLPASVVSRAAHMSATTVSEPGAPSPMDGDEHQGGQKSQQQDGQELLDEDLKHAVAEVAKLAATFLLHGLDKYKAGRVSGVKATSLLEKQVSRLAEPLRLLY
ncbi:muts domain V-domain-containing protein [Dunaliella salina]|uniref:Muts domain V-domain-containing protein n=1 Tax=Dunaliella salina TaxID=3046 RepID=A0ABQ7GUJ8_DUNSA|nr:muts domain V-domain-containing protein [Dunaliella salina]|eukprot:KAF5838281.1 muts domain V-domain-containing protein [Dunaliella salina]